MKIFLFFLTILPLFSCIGFTLQGNSDFCIYFDNPQNDSLGYVIFHPEDYNDKLIEFKASSPLGEEVTYDQEKPFDFHMAGTYKFCVKNMEYKQKNATIYVINFNITLPADISSMNAMEYFADQVYENLNILADGVKTRDQLSFYQNDISESNNEKLNACAIIKIIVLAAIMIAQVCVLKYFINRKN